MTPRRLLAPSTREMDMTGENEMTHPSYQPTTSITQDTEGWRITRKIGAEHFKRDGRYTSLGDVSAMIRKAHRACGSRWKVDGVEVNGNATAFEIAQALRL